MRPEDADLAWAADEQEPEHLRAKALIWLRRAADLAVARFEIDEALALLHRALELEPSRSGRIELWWSIGHACALKYDGDGLWTAMENARALAPDRQTEGRIYSELAFQSSLRAGMWQRSFDRERVSGWISKALELTDAHSPARARALVARTWCPPRSPAAAREALALADGLGDVELRSLALQGMADTGVAAHDFEDVWHWVAQYLELLDQVDDPDHRSLALLSACFAAAGVGRIADARRLARQHDELTAKLTPHHRLHGVAILAMVEELTAGWETIRGLKPRAELSVEAAHDTPCMTRERVLLVCALAEARLGDDEEARRLERHADELGTEGYGRSLSAPRLRLALFRDDIDAVRRLVADPVAELSFVTLATTATRLDALVALNERKRVEEEAPPLLRPGTYLEPFALRALGIVRDDGELVGQAASRFEAMSLDWHAEQTRAVLAGA